MTVVVGQGEGNVQLPEDSSGQKVRTIQLDVPQADGSVATVSMQVVSIRDVLGDEIRFSDRDILTGIYNKLDLLCEMYSRATGQAMFSNNDIIG